MAQTRPGTDRLPDVPPWQSGCICLSLSRPISEMGIIVTTLLGAQQDHD